MRIYTFTDYASIDIEKKDAELLKDIIVILEAKIDGAVSKRKYDMAKDCIEYREGLVKAMNKLSEENENGTAEN